MAYLGYEMRKDYSPDYLRSSPFTDHNHKCLACLSEYVIDPVFYLQDFGEFLVYWDRQNSCAAGSTPCSDIGRAGDNVCCPANQLCIVNPKYISLADCCPIGSLCGSPCDRTEYQCWVDSTITTSATITTTTFTQGCCTRVSYRYTVRTSDASSIIPTSWLTKSTTLSVIPISAIGLNSITTVTTLTTAVELLATRADWTGFASSNPTTFLSSQSTSTGTPGNAGSTNPGGAESTQGWMLIFGPVIGAVLGIAFLVAGYLICFRRRKSAKKEQEFWTDKPELHAESLPSPPGPPQELDARPRSPRELEAQCSEPCQRGSEEKHYAICEHYRMAEIAANEPPAQEMDVNNQHLEVEMKTEESAEPRSCQ